MFQQRSQARETSTLGFSARNSIIVLVSVPLLMVIAAPDLIAPGNLKRGGVYAIQPGSPTKGQGLNRFKPTGEQ
jgi:hypothetical protein